VDSLLTAHATPTDVSEGDSRTGSPAANAGIPADPSTLEAEDCTSALTIIGVAAANAVAAPKKSLLLHVM
jgi:hypothetical protein